MRISELVYKIKSKIRILLPQRLGDERPTSYPFISGDTFRAFCNFRIEKDEDLDLFLLKIGLGLKISTLFLSISYIAQNEFKVISKLRSHNQNSYSEIKVILHNGDCVPSNEFLGALTELFKIIYCVNVNDASEKITPIPIGLENYHYFNNGKLQEFLDHQQSFLDFNKTIIISGCFNLATNYGIRAEVANLMKNSRFECFHVNLTRKKYLEILKKSFFTISPPGNGNDCHRTWEAIYVDTVPIVLNSYLSKNLSNELPIYSVDCYTEIFSKSDNELYDIYSELMGRRSKDLAYFDYWQKIILSKDEFI
jgi:hypothetical protein